MAKGCTQTEHVDHFETFSPVTRISSLRVLFVLASVCELIALQMNVKTTFLNCDLVEEIYMSKIKGCIILGQEKKICKL